MTAGSESSPKQEKRVALNDVSVAQIRNPTPELAQSLAAALFPTSEDQANKKDFEDYIKQLMRHGFIVGVTLNTEPSRPLIGAFVIGEDPYDTTATTISYGRVDENDKSNKGAMTAAGLKVTETLLRKNGILDRGKRKELKSNGNWDFQKNTQEAQLAAKPIRAYVDKNNIASQKMLERMGYVKIDEIRDGNTEYVYEIDLDSFDDAIDNFSNPMRTLQ